MSLPKPWLAPVMRTSSTSACAEPNGASQPICSFVRTPSSYNSITAETVAPNEIGSMPSSLQIMLA